MLWGAISYTSKGPLIRLDLDGKDEQTDGKKQGNGLNGQKYATQVINGPLSGFIHDLEAENLAEFRVVKDGAPAHRSRIAKLARAAAGITSHPHPPNSPEVSPIENVWNDLKKRIAAIPGAHSSVENVWAAAQKVWNEFLEKDILQHTESMHARVLALKAAHGYHIDF